MKCAQENRIPNFASTFESYFFVVCCLFCLFVFDFCYCSHALFLSQGHKSKTPTIGQKLMRAPRALMSGVMQAPGALISGAMQAPGVIASGVMQAPGAIASGVMQAPGVFMSGVMQTPGAIAQTAKAVSRQTRALTRGTLSGSSFKVAGRAVMQSLKVRCGAVRLPSSYRLRRCVRIDSTVSPPSIDARSSMIPRARSFVHVERSWCMRIHSRPDLLRCDANNFASDVPRTHTHTHTHTHTYTQHPVKMITSMTQFEDSSNLREHDLVERLEIASRQSSNQSRSTPGTPRSTSPFPHQANTTTDLIDAAARRLSKSAPASPRSTSPSLLQANTSASTGSADIERGANIATSTAAPTATEQEQEYECGANTATSTAAPTATEQEQEHECGANTATSTAAPTATEQEQATDENAPHPSSDPLADDPTTVRSQSTWTPTPPHLPDWQKAQMSNHPPPPFFSPTMTPLLTALKPTPPPTHPPTHPPTTR
jgi:hypothetical protein